MKCHSLVNPPSSIHPIISLGRSERTSLHFAWQEDRWVSQLHMELLKWHYLFIKFTVHQSLYLERLQVAYRATKINTRTIINIEIIKITRIT